MGTNQPPRLQFEECLEQVLATRDPVKHAMNVGYASGYASALCANDVIDVDTYTRWMDELLTTIEAQKSIMIAREK